MKKILMISTLLINFTFTTTVRAEAHIDYSPGFAIVDLLIYRPIGLVATAVGTGLFVGFSPLTAFSQISPPHDAFEKTADFLVVAPFEHTFSRPLGEWTISE